MVFVLDNYDSFTYNLIHLLYQFHVEVVTARNREITIAEIVRMKPTAIVLSPGPGRPSEAGIMPDLLHAVIGKIPILGVCLGHEAIGEAFGAKIVHAQRIMHGKTSIIHHDDHGLFQGINQDFRAVRYHSFALERHSLPKELIVTALSEEGEIMGVRHHNFFVEGVQYHPESILREFGKEQIGNFLKNVSERRINSWYPSDYISN